MTAHDLLSRDGFAASLGVRLVSVDADHLVVEMDPGPQHQDAHGRLASGVIFSLADCAMSLASNQARTEVAVATNLTRDPGAEHAGTLRAEVSASTRSGSRATTWQAVVFAGDARVAAFTGTTLAVEP